MARHHLENQYSQGPPVQGVGVTAGGDEFRGEVIRRTAGRVRLADGKLRKAHVCELEAPELVQQQVLRLQVSVHDAPLVEVLEGEHDASRVELGMSCAAVKAFAVVGGVELAAQGGLHQEVEGLRPVVRHVQPNDERGVRHQQDVLFIHYALLHASLHHVALAEALHGVRLTGHPVLPQLHRAEPPAAEKPDALQVLAVNALALLPGELSHLGLGGIVLYGASRLLFWRAPGDDVRQRTEEHIERVPVQNQRLRSLRDNRHRRGSRFVVEKRALAEEMTGVVGRLHAHLLHVVLRHNHLAVEENVKSAAGLSLLKDDFALLEVHLDQCLCDGRLLLRQQTLKHPHSAEIFDVLCYLRIFGLHQDVLELSAVYHPHHRGFLGFDGGCTGDQVEQCQLTKTATLPHSGDYLERVAVSILCGDEDLEEAFRDDVEIVRDHVTLCDDGLPLLHRLLPGDVGQFLHALVVESHHGV
mmetsp:Transcript_2764/g.7595  ORF Transcript_2764/g.7595 Transcript_2764/m.7595 type:complete len:471 (-) Transcript_2764:366-1778(-)